MLLLFESLEYLSNTLNFSAWNLKFVKNWNKCNYLPALEVVLMWERGFGYACFGYACFGYASSDDSGSSETEVTLYHAARRYIPFDMNTQNRNRGSER
jgi:hypothetical protein